MTQKRATTKATGKSKKGDGKSKAKADPLRE
jgi:hypothetical protein